MNKKMTNFYLCGVTVFKLKKKAPHVGVLLKVFFLLFFVFDVVLDVVVGVTELFVDFLGFLGLEGQVNQ